MKANNQRFNEVTIKLNNMYNGTDEQKDNMIIALKYWLKMNKNSEDKDKILAITEFLAEKFIF